MSILKGTCAHCGKKKDDHFIGWGNEYHCNPDWDADPKQFYDKGIAALDAHKEELWDVLCKITGRSYYKTGVVSDTLIFPSHVEVSIEMWEELESILNQIEKEK